nr:MAG TPA: crystallin beta/gamma motif-containing protein [Caudoviricetes sp.]
MITLKEAENFEYPEKDIGKPLKNITLSEADSIESYKFKPFEYERGSVTKFATGVVNTIRDMQDMPEQLQIFGNRLSFGFGGYFGDTPEETERKRLNLVTAERNLDAAQRERYKFTSGKEQESLAYGVGGGVVSYGTMLVSGGTVGGAAKVLGASAKVAGALTEAAGIATMGTMELAGAVQDKTRRTEEGEIDVEAMTPEWARNATGGTVAYTALSAVTEKYVGFGRQLKMWEKPVQWGNKVTSNFLTAVRSGAKNAISEGATEGLQDLEATGIGLIDGTVKFDDLPARIQQAWKSAIIGGIIGDGIGTAVAIKSGRNVRKQLRDMVYPVVGDMNEAQNIADAMYNAGTDELTQMMSVELELSSELKNKHGKVWNSMLSAIDRAIADSNSPQFANMTEDQRAEYANTAAKHFADQVLAEANKRGTTIDSIIADTDITYDNGIRLARHINMFDALKNPEMIPPETKLKRTSLTQFLRSRGGLLDVGGDLKSMDAIKGMPGLISKKGIGLDDAALSAWEHGYFPEFSERPSINDLLEAIDEELRGNKRYNVDEQQTFSDQLAMLEEELDREGIDWRNMSPAEIERAVDEIPELKRLEREAEFYDKFEPDIDYNMIGLTEEERDDILERQGMQLYQLPENAYNEQGKADTNSKEFKAWFGDSKVVDGTGKPLVVYHGTGADITSFDKNKISERTKNYGYYGAGFYFTPFKNQASFYGDKRYDVYLSIKKPFYDTKENIISIAKDFLDIVGDERLTKKFNDKIKYNEDFDSRFITQTGDKVLAQKWTLYLKDMGYDGVIHKHAESEEYVVFEPNQIKSVYNRGTFSPESDNIYYQMSDKEIKKHKKKQFDIVSRENPMQDDYHVGIRNVEDIKTFEETLDDEESFVWGDYSREDAEADLERGLVTVYSSYPIKDGVFVSTSYIQANEYAGRSGKVYKKTVSPDKIAWINGDEGQFADVSPEAPYQVSDSFFYQRRGKNAKGATTITPDAYIIKLLESADESTLPHEFAHYWLSNMWNYVRSGRASESYMNRWNTIADYLGVKPEQTSLKRGQQEKFASSYEAYLTKGDLPTPAIQSAFDDYDKWLQRVYNDYNQITYAAGKTAKSSKRKKVRLTDTAIKFFQSMTTGTLDAPMLAPKDTGVRVEDLRASMPTDMSAAPATVVDTTRVVNITEGEKGVSAVFKREGMKNADRIVDELGVSYNKINLEEQAIKATEWVRNNLEEARKVVDGAAAPEGIIDTAIFIAYENEMLRIGNNAEYTRALKIHSQVQSQRGQAIAAERIATNNMTTPAYWLEKVINNREQRVAERLFKGDVKKLRNLITDETKKAAKEVLGKSQAEQAEYLNKLAEKLRKEYSIDTFYQTPEEEITKDNAMNVIHNFLEDAFGITVSQEEADTLINKAEQLKKVFENTLDESGNPSVESFRILSEMNRTVESMSPSHIMTVMSSIYGRSAMLASIKSPVLNILSNAENFATEGTIRRFTIGADTSVDRKAIEDYMRYAWEVYKSSGFIVSGMQDIKDEIVTLGETRPTTQGKGRLRKIAQTSENIVFKYLMGAPDSVTKDMNFVDTADLLATKIAKEEGAQDISKRATEIFKDAILINPLTEQGKQVREQAIEQAHTATFTNNSMISEFSLKARQWLNMIGGNKFKLGDVVMPFVKTPANVQMMGLEYGFGSLYTLYKVNEIIKNPRSEVSKRAIKSAYRNGLGLLLATLIASMFEPDDYIPEFDNATQKDRDLAKAKNAPFNSIKIGNKWVSLDYFGILGIPLVGIMNARKGRNLIEGITGYVKSGIAQGMKIPGIKEGLAIWDSLSRTAAYSTTPKKAFEMVSNALLDQVRARTIPAIVNDVAKVMDKYERDTSGSVLDKVQASIPFLRERLPERYTISGKPLETEGLSVLLFGGRVKTAEEGQLVSEIDKLAKKQEQPSISDVTKYGDLRLLSPEKKIKVRKEFFREYSKEARKVINSSGYRAKSAEDRKKALNKVRKSVVAELKEKYAKDIKREKRRR